MKPVSLHGDPFDRALLYDLAGTNTTLRSSSSHPEQDEPTGDHDAAPAVTARPMARSMALKTKLWTGHNRCQ